jgi:UDP-glucose 4-epimerase
VIGIRHGEKMYETLLTNEECANALDLGDFYRVPCDKRGLNYDKYFKEGNVDRNPLSEFNSHNTELLNVAQVKAKLLTLPYIRDELDAMGIAY